MIPLRPLVAAVTLCTLGWFAFPADAARKLDNERSLMSDSLLGWSQPRTGASSQAPIWIETAQKEGDAVVPPVKRQAPKMPSNSEEAAPQAQPSQAEPEKPQSKASAKAEPREASQPSEPKGTSFGMGSLLAPFTEWLAKANREYQGTIVKELSKPSPEQMEAETKRLAEQKAAFEKAEAEKAAAEKQAAAEAAKQKAASEAAAKAAKDAEAKKQAAATKVDQAPTAEATAEAQKAEAARLAEAKRREQAQQEQARKEKAEADRKTREALAAEERKAREAKLAEERKAKADAQQLSERARPAVEALPKPVETTTQRHRRWTVTIIPEPIERPSAQVARADEPRGVLVGTGRMSLGAGSIRGTAVKRWVWRAGHCRYAGQKQSKRYTVARGDSLWRISEKYYDQGSKYPRIYKANRDRINDPDLIYPCQKFRVPKR